MTRLRIVHVCMSDKWSGSEIAAAEYANGLSADHDIGMIFAAGPHLSPSFYRRRLNPAVRCALVSDPGSARELRAAIGTVVDGTPDLLHAHLGPACRAVGAAFPDVAKLGHLHIRYFPAQHGRLDGVVAVAPWQLRDIPAHYPGKSWLVPNFLQETVSRPATDMRNRLLRMLHLPVGARLVGSVGRLHSDKGIDILIEAQRDLADPEIHLLLFGDGSEELRLRKRAAGLTNVHFMGFRHDVAQLVAGLDLYVSASRAESFGLATLEAMAAGVSVVATRTRGSEWLLEHLPDRLFAIEDIQATAQAIRGFCRSPSVPDYRLARFDKQASFRALDRTYQEMVTHFSHARQPEPVSF